MIYRNIMKTLISLTISFLLYSCSNPFQKKAESLPNCSYSYIDKLVIEANSINNSGNVKFNFYLTPTSKNEHYFYLQYKNKTYFLFYSENEKQFKTKGFYLYSSSDLLIDVSKKVKNTITFGKIKGDPEFYYEITDKEIKKEVLNMMENAKIVSQDKYGNFIKTYTFCKNSIINLKDRDDNITECFLNYYPDYKKFDSIIIKK